MPLEIACFNLASALKAAECGADRIELCSGAEVGGTTPSIEDLQTLIIQLQSQPKKIPVNVMIRPRGGDFCYSQSEFDQMQMEVAEFGALADGFVFGALCSDGTVDIVHNKRLISLARGKPCTFHRAFDSTSDFHEAARIIAGLGFSAILTSGGKPDAMSGRDELAEVVRDLDGTNVDVIVGGGVRSGNIEALKDVTKAKWFHSSALVDGLGVTSGDEVRILVKLLKSKI